MKICSYLEETHIFLDLKPGEKRYALGALVSKLKEKSLIDDDRKILDKLLERETLCSTGLEKGIAVPHVLTNQVDKPLLALALIKKGMQYEAVDQMPTYVLLLILGNPNDPGTQLKILAHVCRLVKETDVVERIKKAVSSKDVCRIINEEEGKIG